MVKGLFKIGEHATMTYKGIVKGNTVVIEEPVSLADGTEVEIIPLNLRDPICGTWQDERNADEIIKDIRSSRFSRERDVTL